MKMKIGEETIVRELVVAHPGIRALFEELGIDYCCGGGNTLANAVAAVGLELGAVVNLIQAAVPGAAQARERAEISWQDLSLTELTDHIESVHHVYTKKALIRLGELSAKVLRAHGANHGGMLKPLQATFSGLREELEMHLMKEEQVLFPYIREMDLSVRETGVVPPMHCGSVQHPINQMMVEHESAGMALAGMRTVTGGYTLPADACQTFAAMFEGMRELEADLHEHIHLENNILFPRAVSMEGLG